MTPPPSEREDPRFVHHPLFSKPHRPPRQNNRRWVRPPPLEPLRLVPLSTDPLAATSYRRKGFRRSLIFPAAQRRSGRAKQILLSQELSAEEIEEGQKRTLENNECP